MKRFYFLVICLYITFSGLGQKLITSVPFSSSSPFLEPEEKSFMAKLGDDEFISIAKVKGGMNGPSHYVFEKYDLSLKAVYAEPFELGPDEDIAEFFFNGKNAVLLTINHDMHKSVSTLFAWLFDPATGKMVEKKTLIETPVANWGEVKYKGAVKETFDDCVHACLNPYFVTHFQYQYNIEFSPDKSKFIAHIYDFGKKTLVTDAKIFDTQLNVLAEGEIPIDNNFINYGIFPNNRGEVYILNADRIGRIVLVWYDLKSKDSKLLDIQYASTNRESLTLKMLNDDVVYVANITTQNGVLTGVMYSKFNFESNLIEKINFYELSVGLKQTIEAAEDMDPSVKKEDWKHYEITNFIMNEYEKIILVLEKRFMDGTNFVYDGTTVNTVDRWSEKPGRISTEGTILFAFNKEDEIIWENFYIKNQQADVNVGLLSASFEFDNTSEGKLRMLYANSSNATGVMNDLKYVEWDEYSGSRVKDIELTNDQKICLMKTHILWWDDKVVVAGRKGLIGKKTFLNLYELIGQP